MTQYKAAIFDMDGTVLDTLDDLTDAINYAMGRCGRKHDFTREQTKNLFGSGVDVAIRRALCVEAGVPDSQLEAVGTPDEVLPEAVKNLPAGEEEKLRGIYRPYYAEHCRVKTGPYKGIPELLRALKKAGVLTAVVSNKPDAAVQKLVDDCYSGMFDAAVGEQAGIRRKPAPDMISKTLNTLGVTAREAVYLGDSEIDLQSAANSGMDCISVSWGFRSRAFLEQHGARKIADTPADVLPMIL